MPYFFVVLLADFEALACMRRARQIPQQKKALFFDILKNENYVY
jgi:hypothetical protein